MSEIVQFDPTKPLTPSLKDAAAPTRGEVRLKGRSILPRDIFVLVAVKGQPGSQSGWFTVPDAFSRFELKAGQPFDVPIAVQIPGGTPAGRYGFQALMANDAATEREFSMSPPNFVDRPAPGPDHQWWKWVAIAAGAVAVVALAVVVIKSLASPGFGDACDPTSPKCPAGGQCPTETKTCAAGNGIACTKDEDCLSRKCRDKACAAAVLGEACYPSQSACAGNPLITCLGATGHCGSFPGGPCTTAADCVAGACTPTGPAGALVCGDPVGQPGCQPAKSAQQCPQEQVCVPSGGGTMCLYKGGTICPPLDGSGGGRLLCASQRCNDKARCAPEDGSCPDSGDCGPGNECINQRCQTPAGKSVTMTVDFAAMSSVILKHYVEEQKAAAVKRQKALANPLKR